MAQQKWEQDVCQLILASSCGPVLCHDHADNGLLTVTTILPLLCSWPHYTLIQEAELMTFSCPFSPKAAVKNNQKRVKVSGADHSLLTVCENEVHKLDLLDVFLQGKESHWKEVASKFCVLTQLVSSFRITVSSFTEFQ